MGWWHLDKTHGNQGINVAGFPEGARVLGAIPAALEAKNNIIGKATFHRWAHVEASVGLSIKVSFSHV